MQRRGSRPFPLLPLAALVVLGGCMYQDDAMPFADGVPGQEQVAIDGVWEVANPVAGRGGNAKVRIERGRAYVLDSFTLPTGMVFLRDLRPLGGNRYRAVRLFSHQGQLYEVKTVLEVISPTEMSEHAGRRIDLLEGVELPFWRDFRYRNVNLVDEGAFHLAHGSTHNAPPGVVATGITTDRVESLVDTVTAAPGAPWTLRRRRELATELSMDTHSIRELGLERVAVRLSVPTAGSVDAEATPRIRLALEKSFRQGVSDRQTFESSVVIDGRVARRWRVAWQDRIATGVIHFTDEDGHAVRIPFRVPISSRMEATPIP